MSPRRNYPGPEKHRAQADAAYRAAEKVMISKVRVYAYACFASYGKKSFTQLKTVALFLHKSERTMQRMIREAKEKGLMTCERIRRGETPKGGRGPLRCGGSWKEIIGWGMPRAQAENLQGRYSYRWHYHQEQRATARQLLRDSLPPL